MVKAYWKREQDVVTDDVVAIVNAGYMETRRKHEQLRRLREKQERQEQQAKRENALYIALVIGFYLLALWLV